MSPAGARRRNRMATNNFISLRTVAIPVGDHDRSVAFFESFGFEKTFDAELQPGFRWVELGLPDGEATISLVARGDQLPAGIDTGIRLTVADAKAAHASVADAGGTVGELLDWPDVPLMFSFMDPDGNRLYVSQTD